MKGRNKRLLTVFGSLLIVAAVLLLFVLGMAAIQNRRADITDYVIKKTALPQGFDGMLIAQVSDYHGDDTCREQILQSLRERQPEIILITGDLLDPEVTEESMDFAKELVSIAPCYFIMGNHEDRMTEEYPALEARLREMGVIVLRNERRILERKGDRIAVFGADDPSVDQFHPTDYAVLCEGEEFALLLAHRPELFEEYVSAGVDLVFTGHAHGGQFRVPGTDQGLFAPAQGFFPKYTQGVHEKEDTTMVISRGIANLYFPPRLFNPPELVYVTLKADGADS